MGRRGPAAAPTAEKLAKGTRADRVNTAEPVPDEPENGEFLQPPEWLTGESVAIWVEYGPDLQKKGVLTKWDVETFAVLCDTVARRRKAAQTLETEGTVIDMPVFDRNGVQTGVRRGRNPWLLVLNQADKALVTWAGRFGLTPSDRSQIASGGHRRDPYDDLLT